jgi:hypothetical protein
MCGRASRLPRECRRIASRRLISSRPANAFIRAGFLAALAHPLHPTGQQ